jgi:hypothetical protein
MCQIRWFVGACVVVALAALPQPFIAAAPGEVDLQAAAGTVDSSCAAPILAVVTAQEIGIDTLVAEDFAVPEGAQIRPDGASTLTLSPDAFENRGDGVYRLILEPADGVWAAGTYQVGLRLDYGHAAEWEIVPILVTAVPSCPSPVGFVQWRIEDGGNGHWYKAVLNTEHLDWTEAEEAAVAEGGYLATITSLRENQFVFGLVDAPEFFSSWNGAGPALGGVRTGDVPDPTVGWSWVTGETWRYTNWHPGQPDFLNENRLQFWSGDPGVPEATWNNLSATDPNMGGYVIERENVGCAEAHSK